MLISFLSWTRRGFLYYAVIEVFIIEEKKQSELVSNFEDLVWIILDLALDLVVDTMYPLYVGWCILRL